MRALFTIGLILGFWLFPMKTRAEFGGHVGAHFGYGRMGTAEASPNSYQSRAIGTFDGEFMPGWRFFGGSLLAGVLFDLRFLAQLSNTAADFSGHGYSLGAGLMYEIAVVKLLFSYDPWERETYSGPNTTFKGSGYHYLLGYKIFPGTSVDLEYVTANFNSQDQGGVESALSPQSVKLWSVAFGLSFSF
jgi:hypothetical protein